MKTLFLRLLPCLLAAAALAQESSPTPAETPAASATPTPFYTPLVMPANSPAVSPGVSPMASPSPSLLKKAGVKIQFLPPPMEGTISLGIYDTAGKLVRTLHREATGDEFVAALDGYITHWDGLDDNGKRLPTGHYAARGYMVGSVTVEPAPAVPPTPAASATGSAAAAISPVAPAASATPSPSPDTLDAALPGLKFPNGKPFTAQEKVHVGLVSNPLEQDRAGSADFAAGFDAKGSWLQLADGLALKKVSTTPNLKWAAIGRYAPGTPLVFFQSDGKTVEEFLITKVSDMMAFDCGGFDYTGVVPSPSP